MLRLIPNLFLGASLLLPLLSYAQIPEPKKNLTKEYESEKPSDPYLPNAYGNKKLSPAYRYERQARFSAGGTAVFSRQVNVDSSQQNIVGDAANEPSIAVNPLNENEIVIGWRQFDNVFSNFRQAGWAYSSDAGQIWTFPGSLNPGVFQSDPVLEADNTGNFYYNSLTSTSVSFPCNVYKSVNAGNSWNNGVYIGGGDKQWMTIDRSGGIGEGNIYSNWTAPTSDCLPGFFTRSTDGASTFDSCTVLPEEVFWGTQAVGNNGELYLCGASPTTAAVKVVKSLDAQNPVLSPTWPLVSTCNLGGYITVNTPINPVGLTGQVSIDVDRSNGPSRDYVYVVASVQPYFNSDPADVMFNRSTDGGLTWNNATPVKINDDTDTTNTQWLATMSVAPNGRIDVAWLDTRDHPGTDTSSLYYSYSVDQGNTWSVNEKLSHPFDPHVGYPNQAKMGDYIDMVSTEDAAHLAWVSTSFGEQNVFYSLITPPAFVGIQDVSGNVNVSVHPNPTSGLLEVTSRDKQTRIEIFTSIGQNIFSTSVFDTRHVIDISSQPSGIYFLKVISHDGWEMVKKIVRE